MVGQECHFYNNNCYYYNSNSYTAYFVSKAVLSTLILNVYNNSMYIIIIPILQVRKRRHRWLSNFPIMKMNGILIFVFIFSHPLCHECWVGSQSIGSLKNTSK